LVNGVELFQFCFHDFLFLSVVGNNGFHYITAVIDDKPYRQIGAAEQGIW
jgi:hypothetical protein